MCSKLTVAPKVTLQDGITVSDKDRSDQPKLNTNYSRIDD